MASNVANLRRQPEKVHFTLLGPVVLVRAVVLAVVVAAVAKLASQTRPPAILPAPLLLYIESAEVMEWCCCRYG